MMPIVPAIYPISEEVAAVLQKTKLNLKVAYHAIAMILNSDTADKLV
jgi:hypothetical protein